MRTTAITETGNTVKTVFDVHIAHIVIADDARARRNNNVMW